MTTAADILVALSGLSGVSALTHLVSITGGGTSAPYPVFGAEAHLYVDEVDYWVSTTEDTLSLYIDQDNGVGKSIDIGYSLTGPVLEIPFDQVDAVELFAEYENISVYTPEGYVELYTREG